MRGSEDISVRGFVADGGSGAGLGGLRVELRRAQGNGRRPLAVSRSNEAGRFGFRVPSEMLGAEAQPAGKVEVQLSVKDHGQLLLHEVHELTFEGGETSTVELSVPPGPRESEEAAADLDGEVRGRVQGGAPDGARVEAVLGMFAAGRLSERVVGEASVNAAGWYRLPYRRPDAGGGPAGSSLVVQVRAPDGQVMARSRPLLPGRRDRVDLTPARPWPRPSEYRELEQHVTARLPDGLQALKGARRATLDQLSAWLEVEPERLRLLARTQRLEAETGLPGALYYALGRAGLPLRLDELVDVPLAELRTTVEEAIASGITCRDLLSDLDRLLEALAAEVVGRALAGGGEARRPGVGAIVAGSGVPADQLRPLLRRYQAREGGAAEFWEGLSEDGAGAEAVGDEHAQALELAVQLGELVGPDPRLLRRLAELRRAGSWQAPEDLTRLDVEGWREILESIDPPSNAEAAAGEQVSAPRAQVQARARTILAAFQEEYPSEFIRRKLIAGDDLRTEGQRLLQRAPDHDLVRGSIRERVAAEPGLLEGFSPEEGALALEEIEATERLSRVTTDADQVAVLLSGGMRSALDISSVQRRAFGDLYGAALGGRAEAAQVYAQAQQAAAASKLAMVGVLQARQRGPAVLGEADAGDGPLKGLPDATTLFGNEALCSCEHCRSVYSPAAYLVDLLRYLRAHDPKRLQELRSRLLARGHRPSDVARLGRHRPLDVLLARRPDLADIPLTCENTLTPLPYIDLVNEVLEARLAGGSAAHDTGKVPADVLRAVPQNLRREAYAILQAAVHPLALPFHEPLAVARAYLGHLGVSRLELMRVLAPAVPATPAAPAAASEALVAEALGMSPEEIGHIARPPAEPWRHVGFTVAEIGPPGAPEPIRFVEALRTAPVLLEALGITFNELTDLVSTRFVNADDALKLDLPGPDCDPARVTVSGLDENRLQRMLRFLRLQRRLGWSLADLDRALLALAATDLDLAVLDKISEVRELARRLDRPVTDLLVLWAPLDTLGKDNRFDRLLRTRAVAWRADHERTFQLRPDGGELAEPSDNLDPVAPALLAAFRITSEELQLARAMLARRGTPARLDLAGLSGIYRIVTLARALQLRLSQLDLLLRLVPAELDPFRPADPAATRRFCEVVQEVQASELTPERLAYLFRHEADPRRDPAPLPAQVEAVLAGVRRALLDAVAETAHPGVVVGDTLRQKLAMLLDPALLDPAMEVLDPRTAAPGARRREFFDRHLARIFPDPPAAAARLFEAPAAAPPTVAEERWQGNIQLVLQHLLPLLRARQMRGAVVQSLADGLSLHTASAALLLDTVLRSRRRPGEPLLADFLALIGTGLTGAYYANPDLQGEPALVRADPELDFSWAGAAPAAGVPGQRFSVRWTGHLLPRSKSPHVFYVRTDGAVRLSIKTGGVERVLIDQTGGPGLVEHVAEPVALEPGRLCELRLEYRNLGGPASLALQAGTAPNVKQALPTADLYAADGLSSLSAAEASYRRLHKAAMLLTAFGTTDAQLAWLVEARVLDLDALPMEPVAGPDPVALFGRWRQLAALYALRKRLPRVPHDLFEVFRAASLDQAIGRLVLATGWERAVVEAFVGPQGWALDRTGGLRWPAGPGGDDTPPPVLRLAQAIELQRRTGVAPAALFGWARAAPDADTAAAIVQAVKARYDEKGWLEVARTLNDPLRARRRDALCAYLLPQMRAQGVKTRDQLFEYFLIDVDMSPCMLTSRIRQGIAAVQTFFQRCLMNLEPDVPPRLIDDSDWKWLKSYRVWEANRKVFLYPENWIEPELRDDKSPLFLELERAILQQEIKKENVEAAFAAYLEGLDEVARLDVRAVWFERRDGAAGRAARASQWQQGTYHVFARSFNAPHVWYYRRLDRGRSWTPWEKIDADIESEHVVPVMFQRRLHLFWTVFKEVARSDPPPERKDKGRAGNSVKHWEIQLAYSVLDRERWSRKRVSGAGLRDEQEFIVTNQGVVEREGSSAFAPADYTLRAEVAGHPARVLVHLYRRRIDPVRRFGLHGPRGFIPIGVTSAGQLLSAGEVDRVGSFELSGTHGALVVGTGAGGAARVERAPPGYRVHDMAFTSQGGGGRLLSLPSRPGGGWSPVLGAPASTDGARLVAVRDAALPHYRGLTPFFFQDRQSSFFVRPIYTTWREPRVVAVPLPRAALGLARHFGVRPRGRAPAPLRRLVPGRGPREDLAGLESAESLAALTSTPAGLAFWEDVQDRASDPDDAAEIMKLIKGVARAAQGVVRSAQRIVARPARAADAARRLVGGRGRRRRPAVVAAPAPQRPAYRLLRQEGYHEQRLRFYPFEHPATARLLLTLKGEGLEQLLALVTTRPPALPSRNQGFAAHYRPGPLVEGGLPPRPDIDFDLDSPYALYNWELFFHAPLQVAIRLAKDGRHEEAQRWFHFIFDPTTDLSAPSPQRYWKFAPFNENREYAGARELTSLLAYQGTDPVQRRRQDLVKAQVTAWLEKPFSPHVIARLRLVAYQKAVVMKYIDNLIEWGDKLFRRDSMESIHEATQIYILARNILGPRPERIAPLVETRPFTFREVSDRVDDFANWEVAFENSQVRRPFRINAQPDTAAAGTVLRMATQYFCLPANPQLDKYWDTVADRLFKIRNCMNIEGVVRQLPLFDPPLDPGLLVRAAAAGVDLGSVIASLRAPPPHHRFRFLRERATRLAEQLRSFGAATLQVLERKDAEGLAALRASGEAALLESAREIHRKQVRQVEEEIAELGVEREHVELQMQHLNTQLQELMNAQETAGQKSLSAAQVVSGIMEGMELASKIAYAIPEFQAGSAGGFSSPFVTLQMGGQMFGDIAAAAASAMEKVMAKHETDAEMAASQAEFQRRRGEWQHELELLAKDRAQIDKRLVETRLKLEICAAELRRHDQEVENAQKVERYLRDKFTSEQLYGWMLGQLSGVYFQAYKIAFDAAQQAERAFRFERGEPTASFIEFSYWDSLKKGLFAGERLLIDLLRMESAHIEGDRRALEVTRHLSLREDLPTALQELLATGRCQLEISEALLDGDFPGHYFRRIRSASLSVTGALRPHQNVNCTLTLLENRIRTNANASGAYPQAEDGEDARFLVNFTPVHAVATSRPGADAGVFELRFDDQRYLPFEGAGAVSTWRLELHQSDNAVALGDLTDVVLTLGYTARGGGAALEGAARASRDKGLAGGALRPPAQHLVSVKRELPELWRRLGEAAPGAEVEGELPLDAGRLSGRYRGLDLRIERVSLFAHPRAALAEDVLRVRLDPPRGSGAAAGGWMRPWAGARALRATAELGGAPGLWKLAVGASAGKVPELLEDLVLVFELRARKI